MFSCTQPVWHLMLAPGLACSRPWALMLPLARDWPWVLTMSLAPASAWVLALALACDWLQLLALGLAWSWPWVIDPGLAKGWCLDPRRASIPSADYCKHHTHHSKGIGEPAGEVAQLRC